MQRTLGEITKLIDGELIGDPSQVIKGFSGIKEAKEGDLTFVAHPKYFPLVQQTKASAIITPPELKVEGKSVIWTQNPSEAFSTILLSVVDHQTVKPKGIHKTAVISDEADIENNVAIGPYVVIESGVKIGENTIIHSGCFVGQNTKIGSDCEIKNNVTIMEKITIGSRVIIHSGTVIGSDGFGFVNVEGRHRKIPQIGSVEIHDDVEIGANVTIDRARFDKTIIGKGTKIDNLVQIAHNVRIGEHCIIVSQVGISGSCTLENHVILAGQVGLAGHLTIGERSVVAAGSGVPNSIPPNSIYWGFPAKPHAHAKRVNASVQRLPHYVKVINDLKKKVEELENKLNGASSESKKK